MQKARIISIESLLHASKLNSMTGSNYEVNLRGIALDFPFFPYPKTGKKIQTAGEVESLYFNLDLTLSFVKGLSKNSF